MFSLYILLFLQIVFFTFNPFFKRLASKNISSNEFVIIYQLMALVLSICYICYLVKYKNCDFFCIRKLNKKDIIYSLMAVLTGFSGSILFLYLVKKDQLSYIIPNIQGIVILLNMVISYFLLKEKITLNKLIGTLLIFFGIIILNYKHFNNKYLSK